MEIHYFIIHTYCVQLFRYGKRLFITWKYTYHMGTMCVYALLFLLSVLTMYSASGNTNCEGSTLTIIMGLHGHIIMQSQNHT